MSLIPPETRALVGSLLGEPVSVEIRAADAERFAYAAGDANPICFDDEAARAAGYRRRVVPPGFLVWAFEAASTSPRNPRAVIVRRSF
jgi:acyl dehydratase